MLRPGMWTPPPAPANISAQASEIAAARYQSESVTNATPAELTGMLFTGVLERIDKAHEHLVAGKRDLAYPHLVRAQDFVTELRSSLDHSVAEISAALDAVYGWALEKLIDAVVHGRATDTAEARKALAPIAQAWHEAVLNTPQARP